MSTATAEYLPEFYRKSEAVEGRGRAFTSGENADATESVLATRAMPDTSSDKESQRYNTEARSQTSLELPVAIADADFSNIRRANRAATHSTLLPVEADIVKERNLLVRKQYAGGLSAGEVRRLTYLNWQIDRIDDAQIGEHLDGLEGIAKLQRDIIAELRTTRAELRDLLRNHDSPT